MPVIDKKEEESPDALKPFLAHGLLLRENRGTGQAQGECPLCGGEKFHVNVTTGLWDCKNCGAEGNPKTFLRKLWEALDLPDTRAKWLANHRKLLFPETLAEWGVRYNHYSDEYVVPGFGSGGKLDQLYRYVKLPDKDKYVLIATPKGKGEGGGEDEDVNKPKSLAHGLFGVPLYDAKKPQLYVCEGPWDGMVLWETLRNVRVDDDGALRSTGSETNSMLKDVNVIAVPGANVFSEYWLELAAGKEVVLLYDNDHPREHPKTKAMIEGAGVQGMRKVCHLLSRYETPPESVKYLRWGVEEHHSEDLPSGYDLRDWLTSEWVENDDGSPSADVDSQAHLRGTKWVHLRESSVQPFPAEWLEGRSAETIRSGRVTIDIEECDNYRDVRTAGQTAFKWTDGMNAGLLVMLASIVSTETVGDQLWVKLIGPPSCGKTELCEALSINKKYVLPVSKFKGFHTGYLVEKSGKTDVSLIHKARNKTLIIKDGDTFLQLPNLPEVMAEMRDIYDRRSRASYKTGVTREYEGVNMTVILAGTESLRKLDDSELGERFLDVVIMYEVDLELERDITLRKIFQSAKDIKIRADGKMESQDSPERVKFKRLVGGYVDHLRNNAQRLLADIEIDDDAAERIADLASFVAHCRCRPSKKQDETVQRELSPRLGGQLFRLAACLAVVLNKRVIDAEVMQYVKKVAMDTSRGRTLNIVQNIVEHGDRNGLDTAEIAARTLLPVEKERAYLYFLRSQGIEVVKLRKTVLGGGVKPSMRWVLSEHFRELYNRVVAS